MANLTSAAHFQTIMPSYRVLQVGNPTFRHSLGFHMASMIRVLLNEDVPLYSVSVDGG